MILRITAYSICRAVANEEVFVHVHKKKKICFIKHSDEFRFNKDEIDLFHRGIFLNVRLLHPLISFLLQWARRQECARKLVLLFCHVFQATEMMQNKRDEQDSKQREYKSKSNQDKRP